MNEVTRLPALPLAQYRTTANEDGAKRGLQLGLQLGYWGSAPPTDSSDLVVEAEALGFDSVWTAEAYGSDALTPLSWLGPSTRRLRLGTAVCQLSARTPTATAMAAMTLDHLSGGRFVLGLGVSGPQVVEGWYGQPYDAPLARTVEYIEIIRKIFDRQGPVSHDGTHFQLPQRQGTGLGHPMKSIVHPLRNDLPIVLGAEGPKNVALAAEVADGWLPIFFSPGAAHVFEDSLDEGFSRPGARRTRDTFEVFASVPVIINDDIEQAAAVVKPSLALYIGGMGARSMNFHFNLIARMGFEAEATKIRDLYLAGQRSDAIASVPDALVESMALIGSKEKIRDDLDEWRESIVTTLLVGGSLETLRTMAELVL